MAVDCDLCPDDPSWISLNVGGQTFLTTRETLTYRDPNSMLGRMFVHNDSADISWKSKQDKNGSYLIDRSPRYFEPILNFLRHGKLIVDDGICLEGVLEEARFYGLISLANMIEEEMKINQKPNDKTPLTRREVVYILMQTPYADSSSQLRFQGVNISGCDLSYLDLRNINFKFANLAKSNLTNANLSKSNMERANLSGATLDNAQLIEIKLTCANLEGASLKNCNFEDPHQHRANLESANLKNANLDGSQMTGINLRVASLKNATLRNCDLRGAVLAGADLENCDLSGSDLQEANLRGANFTNAAFDRMITPLHMAQALS